MSKTMEKIKANLHQDIDKATTKELEKIYSSLKNVLETFHRDSSLKNLCDLFENIFRSKKAKCLQFVNDIYDSKDKLTNEEKDKLRKALLDISNIHRTFIENIISLLGAT